MGGDVLNNSLMITFSCVSSEERFICVAGCPRRWVDMSWCIVYCTDRLCLVAVEIMTAVRLLFRGVRAQMIF